MEEGDVCCKNDLCRGLGWGKLQYTYARGKPGGERKNYKKGGAEGFVCCKYYLLLNVLPS